MKEKIVVFTESSLGVLFVLKCCLENKVFQIKVDQGRYFGLEGYRIEIESLANSIEILEKKAEEDKHHIGDL